MIILCDIGGTFARFSQEIEGAVGSVQKYAAADYPRFEDALARYCEEQGLPNEGTLAIATAAYNDGKVWRFVNRNKWIIDPAALEAAGWKLPVILNDFEAATWGLNNPAPGDFEVLKKGVPKNDPLCLIGPGTGLGLGYLVATAHGKHVQRTHGGHMLAAALTDEQSDVIKTARGLKEGGAIVSFENLVSGPGLQNIYACLCKMRGAKNQFERAEDILSHADDPIVKDALRLFHEFFGLAAQNAVITAHAHGGVYLSGGMMDRLRKRDLFNMESFERFFCLKSVASVTEALQETPIYHVQHPSLAMKGLLEAMI